MLPGQTGATAPVNVVPPLEKGFIEGLKGEPKEGTSGANVRLKQEDAAEYMATGTKGSIRNAKAAEVERGGSVILTTTQETHEFIADAIRGVAGQVTKAYGKVGTEMAGDIRAVSSEDIDVAGWYLELVPDDLHHSYEQHLKAKRQGNIDLTEQDYLNIPDYIDSYDDVLSVNTFKTGDREVVLGKKINGYSVIVALISGNRKSLHFKNMWGLDTPTYEKRYGKKGRSTASHPGRSSVSANDPTGVYHSTSSIKSIPQLPGKVKLQSGPDAAAGLSFQQGLDPGAGRIAQMKAALQGGVEAAAPEPSSPLEARLRQERGVEQEGPFTGEPGSGTIEIGRSLGAKAVNYDVMDLDTGEIFHFTEGTKIQDVEVFAGKGSRVIFRNAAKYAERFGGDAKDWQHVKGFGILSTPDGDRKAEVHWVQCAGIGKFRFFCKGVVGLKVKYIGPDYVELPTGTVREVLSIEKGWYRIMTELDETYLFPPKVFEVVEGSEADVAKRKD